MSLVDIIIPSYSNTLKYLKTTVESIVANTEDYHLYISNSGDNAEVRSYLLKLTHPKITIIDSTKGLNFATAINVALQQSTNDVVLLNNDVIVGKNWLTHLKNSPFDITNPFSNCDAWIHNRYPEINGVKLKPYMEHSDIDISSISQIESFYPGEAVEAEWVAFYATYIRRSVINAVGLLDPNFDNGGEDIDYCRRATKQGFNCGYNYSSWVFHFGGKTRLVDKTGRYIQGYRKEDDANHRLNKLKQKTTICIHTGKAWEPWTIENVNTKGIGGSETCAALLAKTLANKEYRCILIGDCEKLEGTYDDVEYIHHTKFNEFKQYNYIDYFISSRRLAPLLHPIKNGKNYVWVHDIWLCDLTQNLPNITYICLSKWHKKFFSKYHNIPLSQIEIIGNGLDITPYQDNSIKKDPYRLIYSSCPSRGLLTLLKMFKKWKVEYPKLNLHVFYGFDTWKKLINQGNWKDDGQLAQIEELMKQKGVRYHGRVPQSQLAIEQMKSTFWVYPTQFPETYCITAIEAMAAKTIPITTNFVPLNNDHELSALETTIPDGCGVKVKFPEDCFQSTKDLLDNQTLQKEYQQKGHQYVIENCNWNVTANKWINLFQRKDQMTKPIKIGIGLPMLFPYVHYKFVNSLFALNRPTNSLTISLVGSLTSLARNQIVDIAQKQGCTHLLFLDTDMTFPPDTLKRLLAHNKDIVSGLYFERYAPYRPILRKVCEDGYSLMNYPPAGLIECDALGAGCLLINMRVFDKLSKPYFEYRIADRATKESFLSEDLVFCQAARNAGFKIYCDTSIRCGHLISDVEIKEHHWDGSSEPHSRNWG